MILTAEMEDQDPIVVSRVCTSLEQAEELLLSLKCAWPTMGARLWDAVLRDNDSCEWTYAWTANKWFPTGGVTNEQKEV